MSVPEARPLRVRIRGPLQRSDLPGLYARVCSALTANPGRSLVCDVSEVAIDAVAVEALARLALGARRHHARLRIENSPARLRDLMALCGLTDVLAA